MFVCISVYNKSDLQQHDPGPRENWAVSLSAIERKGVGELVRLLHRAAGLQGDFSGAFSARRRHLDALGRARQHLDQGREQLEAYGSPETLAEELRLAQRSLGEVTGEVLPDDLLAEIFSSFCIGK